MATVDNFFNFQLNVRKQNFKSIQMTPKSRSILEKWLKADYQLYNYFNDILDDKIQRIGSEKISREVELLKQMNAQLKKDCNVQEKYSNTWNSPMSQMLLSDKIIDYDIKQNCALFATSEYYFSGFISRWQTKMSENKSC